MVKYNIKKFMGDQIKMQSGENNKMTIAKAFETIITERGKEVLKSGNMVQSMIMDYVGSGYDNEKKLFKISCQHGILNYAYEILSLNDNAQRRLVANKAKKWLETEAFLSEENAIMAVNIILEAIHTNFQLEIENIKHFEDKNNVSNFKNIVEKKDAYCNDILEDAEKCFKKGNDYYNGQGVEQNYIEAVKWYRKAAEQGQAEAQFNYGWCLENGIGIKRDEMEAVKWYKKAAEQGYDKAKKALRRLS